MRNLVSYDLSIWGSLALAILSALLSDLPAEVWLSVEGCPPDVEACALDVEACASAAMSL